jgi:RNA:NAD 2'-phosphotransferase (TPT1/KptA family)
MVAKEREKSRLTSMCLKPKPQPEKLGIDHAGAWAAFERVAERLEQNPEAFLTWEEV